MVAGLLVGALGVQLLRPQSTEAASSNAKVNVGTSLPSAPGTMKTFKAVNANLNADKAKSIAGAFGMQGSPTGGNVLGLEEGGKSLKIQSDTGSIRFMDTGRMGKDEGKSLPNAGQGGAKADKFISDNKLLGQEAHRSGVDIAETLQQTKQGGPTSTRTREMQVNYRFKLKNMDVEGPGAKATVFMGDNGDVVGFFKAWREVAEDKDVKTKSSDKAIAALMAKGEWNMNKAAGGPVREIHINKARLAYWAEDIGKGLVGIDPAYIFEGTLERFDGTMVPFMQKVSAVDATADPTTPPASPSQSTRPAE